LFWYLTRHLAVNVFTNFYYENTTTPFRLSQLHHTQHNSVNQSPIIIIFNGEYKLLTEGFILSLLYSYFQRKASAGTRHNTEKIFLKNISEHFLISNDPRNALPNNTGFYFVAGNSK
jgi:hypothetical protein